MSENATYLLLYAYVEDMADRRGPYRDGHLERIRAEQEAGHVVMAGALGDPPRAGALVFQGVAREHVERFTAGDPYVQAGLVTEQWIEPWTLV
jgi:uncharacterized protein YciI